jgi:hypothetical protein
MYRFEGGRYREHFTILIDLGFGSSKLVLRVLELC